MPFILRLFWKIEVFYCQTDAGIGGFFQENAVIVAFCVEQSASGHTFVNFAHAVDDVLLGQRIVEIWIFGKSY